MLYLLLAVYCNLSSGINKPSAMALPLLATFSATRSVYMPFSTSVSVFLLVSLAICPLGRIDSVVKNSLNETSHRPYIREHLCTVTARRTTGTRTRRQTEQQ